MEVASCAIRLDEHHYLIAEDWVSHSFARKAAKLAVALLKPGSGYGGGRDMGALADYVAGLLELTGTPYGCSFLKVKVLD